MKERTGHYSTTICVITIATVTYSFSGLYLPSLLRGEREWGGGGWRGGGGGGGGEKAEKEEEKEREEGTEWIWQK